MILLCLTIILSGGAAVGMYWWHWRLCAQLRTWKRWAADDQAKLAQVEADRDAAIERAAKAELERNIAVNDWAKVVDERNALKIVLEKYLGILTKIRRDSDVGLSPIIIHKPFEVDT